MKGSWVWLTQQLQQNLSISLLMSELRQVQAAEEFLALQTITKMKLHKIKILSLQQLKLQLFHLNKAYEWFLVSLSVFY